MMNPKLTVVSISYNQEKYIRQALESFLMQKTNFPIEIIIADDASTDKTQEIIAEYAEKYPEKIKPVFRKKNLGAMENFIETLASVKSEYVIYCEGDDYFTDSLKLQKQVDFLDANPDYSICFHPVRVFFEDGSRADDIFPTKEMLLDRTTFELDDLIKQNFMQTNSVMYRWRFNEENIKEIFPKDIMPGDWFLHLLHSQKGKIKYIDEVMADYRRHQEGIWWESSINAEKIHLKYGIQELNFHKAVENLIAENKVIYHKSLIRMAIQFLVMYIKNKKSDDVLKVLESCPEVEAIFTSDTRIESLEIRLKKHKKYIYILFTACAGLSLIVIVNFLQIIL